MSVLLLHRNPLEPFPYHRWLHDYPGAVVLLAARDRIEAAGEPVPGPDHPYARLELRDDFADERRLTDTARSLAAEHGVRYVVAHNEADVLPAATVRQDLGLPGPWPADLLPYRDKPLMKRLAAKAGVEVAPHTVASTEAEARDFAAAHGYPLVCKDRSGYNAIGLRVLRSADEALGYFAGLYRAGPRRDRLLEAFVPGRMCHVDGLVVRGETVLAWASQYQYDLGSFGTDPGARIDLTLDPADPLSGRLIELTDRVLAALRRPDGRLCDHAFHAEIFHTPDDRLVLCEIAARPGGAKIREVCQVLFGANLGELATRVQAGLPPRDLLRSPRPAPAQMAGQLLMMKRPGVVLSVPAVPSEPWVERFWLYAEPGEVVPPAGGSSDFLTAVVGSAPSRAECERRLRGLGARFERQTEISTGPAGPVDAL